MGRGRDGEQPTSLALGTGAGPGLTAELVLRGRATRSRRDSPGGPGSRGQSLRNAFVLPRWRAPASHTPGGDEREAGGHARFPEPPRSIPDLWVLLSGPGKPALRAAAAPRVSPPARGVRGRQSRGRTRGKHLRPVNPSLGCHFRVPAPLWCVWVWGVLAMKQNSQACPQPRPLCEQPRIPAWGQG